MDLFDENEKFEIKNVEDDKDFRNFQKSSKCKIVFVPQPYKESDELVMKPDSGDFAKWIHQNNTDINVEVLKADGRLVLHSEDIWLPLAYLASDVTLPVYLNLVASYLYDRMKGALKGEKSRVHLEAIYEDKKDGISKKFCFDGDSDGLEKAIKKFNLNKFLSD